MTRDGPMSAQFRIEWVDREREPQSAPDPAFPFGRDIDGSGGRPSCRVALPYPAKRCGFYVVECRTCGYSIGITTAGRPDDPRSVRVPCKLKVN